MSELGFWLRHLSLGLRPSVFQMCLKMHLREVLNILGYLAIQCAFEKVFNSTTEALSGALVVSQFQDPSSPTPSHVFGSQ